MGVREPCVPKQTIVCRVQGSSLLCKDLCLPQGCHHPPSDPNLSALQILIVWGPEKVTVGHVNASLMGEQGRDEGHQWI